MGPQACVKCCVVEFLRLGFSLTNPPTTLSLCVTRPQAPGLWASGGGSCFHAAHHHTSVPSTELATRGAQNICEMNERTNQPMGFFQLKSSRSEPEPLWRTAVSGLAGLIPTTQRGQEPAVCDGLRSLATLQCHT